MHLLMQCVAHNKNIDFMAKHYSHVIVAACLNAKKVDRIAYSYLCHWQIMVPAIDPLASKCPRIKGQCLICDA